MKPDSEDYDLIYLHTKMELEKLRDKKIFLTGGTGFVGLWLLHFFQWANENHATNIKLDILARTPDKLKELVPYLWNDPRFQFFSGDIRSFSFPMKKFDYVIHAAATAAHDTYNHIGKVESFNIVSEGTHRLLDFVVASQSGPVLYLSSGACYGARAQSAPFIREDSKLKPALNEPNSGLGLGKRAAEDYCEEYRKSYGLDIKIARCFTFMGPFLPVRIHYAIGNFIFSGVENRKIVLKSSGGAFRSYMYSADLVAWLIKILITGKDGSIYNVGSEKLISIKDLATTVGKVIGPDVTIEVPQNSQEDVPSYYIPDTSKIRSELMVSEWTSLEDGIRKSKSHFEKNKEAYLTRI